MKKPRRKLWDKKRFLKFFNYWPPYLGAGIHIDRIAADFRTVDVSLKLRWWNRNYVGTHFGGSLYSMCDPFFMLILMENLGRDYIVWDKAATIRFKKPGRGTVRVRFHITPEEIERIRHTADTHPKVEPEFTAAVHDAAGEVVAEVHKVIYVKRKPAKKTP